MRSIWKGTISFGLVSIPVRLYPATEEHDVSFHQVRRGDGSRIRYKRVAVADGAEVSYAEIAKGYELPSGETVVLTDDDFAKLPLPTSRTVDVLEFVPLEQVDPIYFARSYYAEPDRVATRSYALLRDALERSGRVALVKVALRQREQLATLRVRDGVLVLSTMIWPDEVRAPDFPFREDRIELSPQELTMAQSLIDTLSADFDPTSYTDGYRQALQAVIEAKVSGNDVALPGDGEPVSVTGDLVATLAASIATARSNQRGPGLPAGPDVGPGPRDSESRDRGSGGAGAGVRAAKKSSGSARREPPTFSAAAGDDAGAGGNGARGGKKAASSRATRPKKDDAEARAAGPASRRRETRRP